MWSRRHVLGAGAGLFVPRLARPAQLDEQVFVFVLARGGWDTSMVFASLAGVSSADVEEGQAVAEVGDLRFVEHADRPTVTSFFERWGDRAAILNGIEVRSVAHERCLQLMATGGSSGDDWATTLAAHSALAPSLPHLVLAGPAYASAYAPAVVRVGDEGQLNELLDGSYVQHVGHTALPADARAAVDAWLADRSHVGPRAAMDDTLQGLAEEVERLRDRGDLPDLAPTSNGCSRDLASDFEVAFNVLESGLSRCVSLQHEGWCSRGWDTHSNNSDQSVHYEELFAYLDAAMDLLAKRPALAERLTIVVTSEMGRHPTLNTSNGRDHWTWTSAMLLGAGVAGGRTVGTLDAEAAGEALDLVSGDPGDTTLRPEHLGSTLLTLAGHDGESMTGAPPIEALLG